MVILYEPDLTEFAKLLSQDLHCDKLQLNISQFSNGEFKIDPIHLDDTHVLVIFSCFDDINSQLMKYLLILQNIQDAKIIDVFIPYIPYSRQDKSKSFEFVLNIFRALKIRKIITIDLHKNINDKFIVNIFPHELFGEHYLHSDFIVIAPDIGAVHRAKAFAEFLNTELVIIDKVSGRTKNIEVVKGRNCLIVDDIIDTGKTIRNAKTILTAYGAKHIEYSISSDARNNLSYFHKSISEIIQN